jgi:hypothetical protein
MSRQLEGTVALVTRRAGKTMLVFRCAALVALLASPLLSRPASAHCDTTRGPVVTAARAALEAGDANLVLHWVRPDDDAAVKSAFQQTLQVRALGREAKGLADRYFFETLVRIHRAGEGAPYTGLSDEAPEPIIAATDRALERGSADELEQQLIGAVKTGLAERFSAARAAARFRPGDVAGGRAFVAAYVPLTHWVEGVFTVASEGGDDHALVESHDPATHPTAHRPGGQTEAAAAETHGRNELRHLPWILAGLLAITAGIEGAFLVRRRRHRASA